MCSLVYLLLGLIICCAAYSLPWFWKVAFWFCLIGLRFVWASGLLQGLFGLTLLLRWLFWLCLFDLDWKLAAWLISCFDCWVLFIAGLRCLFVCVWGWIVLFAVVLLLMFLVWVFCLFCCFGCMYFVFYVYDLVDDCLCILLLFVDLLLFVLIDGWF